MKNKILIAEDDADIGRLTMFKLKREGFEVTWVRNGSEAVETSRLLKPDLIILDIGMPVMDGYEAYGEIREQVATKEIPVIFLTARGQKTDVVKGIKLGVDDYIRKPFKPNELVERVKMVLEKKTGKESEEADKEEADEGKDEKNSE